MVEAKGPLQDAMEENMAALTIIALLLCLALLGLGNETGKWLRHRERLPAFPRPAYHRLFR